MKNGTIKLFLITSISLTLAACGGGGGSTTSSNSGNNSSASHSGPTIVYTGVQDAAVINKNTATDITEAIQLAPSLILLTESLTIPVPSNTPDQKINEKIENNKIILTGEIAGNSGYLTVEYKNYTKDGMSISGKQTQNYIRDGQSLRISSFYFEGLEFISATDRIQFNGSVAWNNYNTKSKSLTLDCLVTDINLNKSMYFKNMSLDYQSKYISDSVRSDDSLSINGTFFVSQLGHIKVSTLTPLPITPTLETVLDFSANNGGLLKLIGNSSEAILYSISSAWFGFGIDTNNDQIIDVSRRYSWNSVDPIAAGIQADTQPIANAGYINYWEAQKPFQLNSLFSHFNDAFIEHEWTLTYKPNNSKAVIKNTTSPLQSFLPDVTGDYVFSVKIKSDRKASTTNFVLRVYDVDIDDNHDDLLYAPPKLIGGVEVKKTDTSILFDFQSYVKDIHPFTADSNRQLAYINEFGNLRSDATPQGFWLSPSVMPSRPGIYNLTNGHPINIAFNTIPFESIIGIKSDKSKSEPYLTLPGDFNNDRKEDILFLNANDDNGNIVNPTMNLGILQSTPQGYEIYYLNDIPLFHYNDYAYEKMAFHVTDMNGDGFDDIVINTVLSGSTTQKINVIFLKANNQQEVKSIDLTRSCTITDFGAYKYRIIGSGNIQERKGKEVLIGDGCNNAINVISANESNTLIQEEDIKSIFSGEQPFTLFKTTPLKLIDLNADGYEDILIGFTNNFTIYTSNKDGTFNLREKIPREFTLNSYDFWYILKLNEDSTTIFYGTGWHFYTTKINQDFSFITNQWPDSLRNASESGLSSVIAKDINSDGKKDIIAKGTFGEYIFIQQKNEEYSTPYPMRANSHQDNTYYLDINNDGKIDAVYPYGRSNPRPSRYANDYDIFQVLLNDVSEYSKPILD